MRKREVHAGGPLFCEGVAIQFPSDPTQNVTFTYDSTSVTYGIGRLTGRTDPSGSYTFYYDAHGNLKKEEKTVNSILYTTQYTYNNNNILTSITYPSGRVITYIPDQIGRVSQVSTTLNGNPKTLASAITYLPFGGITGLTYGNGLTLSQGYDNQYRISSIVTGSILNLALGYDANGNITSITNPDPPGGQVLESPGVYTYQEGANKLTHIAAIPPIDFGYDENANITTENTWTYVYDLSNQLIRVLQDTTQVAEYTYNGAGQRIKKVTQTETKIFHYDLRGHLIAETNQTGQMLAEYVYLGDQLLSIIKPGELAYYFHNDHLGTPHILTNDSQAIAWKTVYTPFGEAVASIQTVENPFRFPGQYYDPETGLHYNYFRYYNPQTGRYITPDPIGLEGGINLFAYVRGNPLRWVDPFGLTWGSNISYFFSWLLGLGNSNTRNYGPSDIETQEMIDSRGGAALRSEFYKKGCPNDVGFEYSTSQAAWDTLLNRVTRDLSSTALQVGGFDATATNNGNGTVTFTIKNTTGIRSATYHLSPWDSPFNSGPLWNIYQTFQWTEKINENECKCQK